MVATDTRVNPDWGMPGPHTSEGMNELWSMAEGLNAHALTDEQRARGERYIPMDAVEIRHDILPRDSRTPDPEKVREYADVFDHLPGIDVQAGSLVLVDGLTRLNAGYELEGRYHIRAVFRDVSDADLYVAAAVANLHHGQPLKVAERRAFAERVIRDPDRAGWSHAAVGRLVQMHAHTIATMREKLEHPTRKTSGKEPTVQLDGNIAPEQPPKSAAPSLFDAEPDPTPPAAHVNGTAPSPRSSAPAKPLVAPDIKELTRDWRAAARLFDDYNPEYIVGKTRAAARAAHVRQVEGWATWCAEFLAAARELMEGA